LVRQELLFLVGIAKSSSEVELISEVIGTIDVDRLSVGILPVTQNQRIFVEKIRWCSEEKYV